MIINDAQSETKHTGGARRVHAPELGAQSWRRQDKPTAPLALGTEWIATRARGPEVTAAAPAPMVPHGTLSRKSSVFLNKVPRVLPH